MVCNPTPDGPLGASVEIAEIEALAVRAEAAGQSDIACVLAALIATLHYDSGDDLARHVAPFVVARLAAMRRRRP